MAHRIWTTAKLAELAHCYWDEKMSSSEVVEHLHLKIKPCHVSCLLRKYGFPVRTLSESQKLLRSKFIIRHTKAQMPRREWTSDLVEKVRHLYWDMGMGACDIEKELSIPRYIIIAGLKRHGIPLRSHSEAQKIAHRRHPTSYNRGAALNWKGGRKLTSCGYYMVLLEQSDPFYCMAQRSGYVMEHRYVMAKYLGRSLESWEVVHHKNRNKSDNRLENLHLYPAKLHRQSHIEWKLVSYIKRLEQRVILLEAENVVLRTQQEKSKEQKEVIYGSRK